MDAAVERAGAGGEKARRAIWDTSLWSPCPRRVAPGSAERVDDDRETARTGIQRNEQKHWRASHDVQRAPLCGSDQAGGARFHGRSRLRTAYRVRERGEPAVG